MAKDTNLEEVRRAVLNSWAQIEAEGKRNSYAFRQTYAYPQTPEAAKLVKVRVSGRWNSNTRRVNGKYLTLTYDKDESTTFYGTSMPDDIHSLLNRTMSESDFDSMEFYREELAGKVTPRMHTFQVEMKAVLEASKIVTIRASTPEEAIEKASQDEHLTNIYGWNVKGITEVEVGEVRST